MSQNRDKFTIILLVCVVIVLVGIIYSMRRQLSTETESRQGAGDGVTTEATSPAAQSPLPQASPENAGISMNDLKDATYGLPIDEGTDGITLTNGEYEWRGSGPGEYFYLGLTDSIAFGDLNGDGIDDAAIILVWNGGGSGSFYILSTVVDKRAVPINVGLASIGDRVVIKHIRIANGTIIVRKLKQGPNDGMCCPTVDTTLYYRLAGDQLIAQ